MTHYENIPDELKALPQWVCADDNSKCPMSCFGYECASSTNPNTWGEFEDAMAAVNGDFYPYAGFVFADNGIVGIDIDAGFDEDGFISPLAADIISHCQSYTEKSKSGRGFHILLHGDLPFKGKNNLAGVEIYKSARYFIMTGNVTLYDTIIDNQPAIDYVLAKYFPETRAERERDYTPERIYTPQWERPTGHRIKVRPVYPRIPSGARNLCLTSLAGLMHNQGYSKQQIYDELLYANEAACDPPLERRELQSICNSVTRYKR